MGSDGKFLDELVSTVESLALPQGFKVERNQRYYDEDGVQEAELDITISGQVGTTHFQWLIECRDRPSQGAGPISWIEQLVGRRDRYKFDRVIAVSSTGFSKASIKYANDQRIELREVSNLDKESLASWLGLSEVTVTKNIHDLKHADLIVESDEAEGRKAAFEKVVTSSTGGDKLLRSVVTGNYVTVTDAFIAVVSEQGNLFDELIENGSGINVVIRAKYLKDNCFVVETESGDVRIAEIIFRGELRIEQEISPIVRMFGYQQTGNDQRISESVAFQSTEVGGVGWSLEFHRLSEDEVIHVLARKS